ncbi:SDR family oxidoreductase [Dyadobacter sp. LJ53]|uniref:SDR family oxidoreductase n=1 Tax=Dyadobacter chenwenxiniae TaxID=2906456 RepID=UPI001F23CD40|nr:SDR family oxidoreductase [Dyadobacter chenwenxiniae]MCF0049306.1 SDR family oxidoreductase [Dyadobacter chenwenxiniae]
MMILVTTATGHLGKKTLDFLIQKVPALSLAALVRDPAKAEDLQAQGISVRIGDYTDPISLDKAFQGIDTLLLISSGTLDNRVEQHQNAINAAKAAGVKHLIYTSVVKASSDLTNINLRDHYHTEEMIKQSGIDYTVFRNTFYANLLAMTFGDALTTGTWSYPAGQAKINVATRSDIAEALANVLVDPTLHVNQIYEITAPISYTFYELAEIISGILKTPIEYRPISPALYKEKLVVAGVPQTYIPFMVGIAEGIGAGEFDVKSLMLKTLLNREPENLGLTLSHMLAN